jgi:carbon-monoxide dehydrogenase small subunit
MKTIKLKVNGLEQQVTLKGQETLLDVLRFGLNLTGTKRSCDTGDCGACSVLLDGKLVNACLVLAFTAEGKEVTTIEGLGRPDNLHPIQRAYYEKWASHCGMCTPGMIMATKALLDENPNPTTTEIRHYLAGNLCRCTGYVKIVEAVQSLVQSGQATTSRSA